MNSSRQFLYLSQEDVIAAGGLEMAETIRVVEQAICMANQGQALEPLMPSVGWDGGEGQRLHAQLGALAGDLNVAAVKWVAMNPTNPWKRNTTRGNMFLILSDPHTSFPLAVMDGTLITATTVGAASAVAAKYLARPDSEAIGLIGAGVITRGQITALREVLKHIKRVKVFDLNTKRAEAFAQEIGEELSLPMEVMGSAKDTVEGSDVVAVATSGVTPADSYIEASWIKEGSLLSIMSSYDAKVETIARSDKVVLDTLQALDCEDRGLGMFCAQGLLKREDILDLADIVAGKLAGRETDTEKIFYIEWGLVVNDLIEAYRIYQRAKEEGIGQILELWHKPRWT
jgi:ornithine cyclodeaminase/alanine dehydrogenase-like protein (mu-crystallin family)